MPPDPSVPPTPTPPPPPARRLLNGLGGALGAEGEVALLPAATNGWVGAAGRRPPSLPAGLPGVRGASSNPPAPAAPRPAPLPAGGRARAVTRESAGAADLEDTGRARPPAPAAGIWPLRPALTPEVAPGPRRRRPFVSGAAWRRAPRASPCARRRRRPGQGDNRPGAAGSGSGSNTCPPPLPRSARPRLGPQLSAPTHLSPAYHPHA